jgi:hypothetical protein
MQKQKYPELFSKSKSTKTETYDKKVLKLSQNSNTIQLYVSNDIYERANNGE